MKNDDREYIITRDGKGITVTRDAEEGVVVLDFEGSATVFIRPEVGMGLGADILRHSSGFFKDVELKEKIEEEALGSSLSSQGEDVGIPKTIKRNVQVFVGEKYGKVTLNFGSGDWIGLDADDAKEFAKVILMWAEKVENDSCSENVEIKN